VLAGDRSEHIRRPPAAEIPLGGAVCAMGTLSAPSVWRQLGPEPLRVDLLGVEVEPRQRSGARQSMEDDPSGEDRPVGRSSDRDRTEAGVPDGDRELPQRTAGDAHFAGSCASFVDPIAQRRRVVLTRVVGETFLGEDLVRPRRLPGDREGGCAVADGANAGQILDRLARPAHILGERLGRLGVHGHVLVAVARDLVTPFQDPREQSGMLPGGHAEDEESCPGPDLVEEPEQRVGLALERRPGPLAVAHSEPSPDELVPVLEVDAEQKRCGHDADRLPQESSFAFDKLVRTRERRWSVC
jgi:hypothetical protein